MKNLRNNILIELHVPNFQVAKDFYSKLGFVVAAEDIPTETEKGYLSMKRSDGLGDTLIAFYGGDDRVFGHSYFKRFSKETKRGYAVEVTMPVEDIDALYRDISEELKDYIVRELKEIEDYGRTWKDFRMEDPFGFYIRFTDLLDWGQ